MICILYLNPSLGGFFSNLLVDGRYYRNGVEKSYINLYQFLFREIVPIIRTEPEVIFPFPVCNR